MNEHGGVGESACGAHFRICSPLSDRPYSDEVREKRTRLEEQLGPLDDFRYGNQRTGYRTKVEFSFWYTEEQGLSLAFFNRGGKGRMPLPSGCALISEKMNTVALHILSVIRTHHIDGRMLKTLIVRESKSDDERIAILYVKNKHFEVPASAFAHPLLKGMMVVYSDHRSPASITTACMSFDGECLLAETINERRVTYEYDSFFQNNIPLFVQVLTDMRKYIPPSNRIVDVYCGVGTIGIALSAPHQAVHGIELSPSMVARAMHNASVNKLPYYTGQALASEKITSECIQKTDTVVIDPPRAGIHPAVVSVISSALPERIIYLSCNPETQARDLALLKENYSPLYMAGYDFYPGTLHQESLVVLSR